LSSGAFKVGRPLGVTGGGIGGDLRDTGRHEKYSVLGLLDNNLEFWPIF